MFGNISSSSPVSGTSDGPRHGPLVSGVRRWTRPRALHYAAAVHIWNTLAPVFLIVLLGFLLRRQGLVSAAAQKSMSDLCYWIALPVLLFMEIAQAPALDRAAWDVVRLVLTVTVALVPLSLLAGRLIGLRGGALGTLAQAAIRGNLAFVALPVIVFAFAADPRAAEAAKAATALALGPIIAVYNLLCIPLLLLSQHRLGPAALRLVARQLAGNPLLLACLAGLAWNAAARHLPLVVPPFAARTLGLLGNLALPLALLCIGGTLAAQSVRPRLKPAIVSALLKTAAAPALGWLCAKWFGLAPQPTAIGLILLAAPTAAASYVLVQQLGGDSELSAASVVVSTLVSAASLAAVIACGCAP